MIERDWLIFGVGSPEPKFTGSRFNVGAAVLDLLADTQGLALRDKGSLKATMIQCGDNYAVLAKPNIIPEMVRDAVQLAKTSCHHDNNCVVLVYGDPDHRPGDVKLKRSGGASGNKVIEEFLNHFNRKEVLRLRVGIGKLRGSERNHKPHDIPDEDLKSVMSGMYIAAQAIYTLVSQDQLAAVQVINKAKKSKSMIGSDDNA